MRITQTYPAWSGRLEKVRCLIVVVNKPTAKNQGMEDIHNYQRTFERTLERINGSYSIDFKKKTKEKTEKQTKLS